MGVWRLTARGSARTRSRPGRRGSWRRRARRRRAPRARTGRAAWRGRRARDQRSDRLPTKSAVATTLASACQRASRRAGERGRQACEIVPRLGDARRRHGDEAGDDVEQRRFDERRRRRRSRSRRTRSSCPSTISGTCTSSVCNDGVRLRSSPCEYKAVRALLHLRGMRKRGGNHPVPGHFKVQGGAVEDRDIANMSKQALVREAARLNGARRRRRRRRPSRARGGGAEGRRRGAAVAARARSRARGHERAQAGQARQAVAGRKAVAGREAVAGRAAVAGREARRTASSCSTAKSRSRIRIRAISARAARGVIRRMARVALSPLALARAVVDRFRDHD